MPHGITPFSDVFEYGEDIKIPADTYTRLQITSDHKHNYDSEIPYSKRKLFWRLTIGKRYTTNATLKAKAGRFVATVPLLTMDHESSSKKGESFTRGNAHTSFDFPLFLIRGDGAADVGSFDFVVNASDGTQSNAASLALNVAERFLKTVAPASGVLTTLTEDENRDRAGALDNAVNQLFSASVSERQSFDINLKSGKGYLIDIVAPQGEGKWTGSAGGTPTWRKEWRSLGRWKVSFAPPRPSVFSDILCAADSGAVCDKQALTQARRAAVNDALSRPMSVLAFKLFDADQQLGTVGSYLRQQSWWSDAATGGSNPGMSAAEFCRRVRADIVGIGLNDLDGRIVAEALSQSDMAPGSIRSSLRTGSPHPDCTAAAGII
jgi:hypothetical protein